MQIEFKEKTYEKSFCAELARQTNIMFSPDQCDEFFLGFDEAVYLPQQYLLGIIGHRRLSRRRRQQGIFLREVNLYADELSRRLPDFKLNLFIQYKRPEIMTRSSSLEWKIWDGPYYRYEITAHQQKALQKLREKSHRRAEIVYASPAFSLNDELWDFCKTDQIINNSNIADIALIGEHGKFTYAGSGHSGIACSDPESIESRSFQEIISERLENPGLPFRLHIEKIARSIYETAQELNFLRELNSALRVFYDGEESFEYFMYSLAVIFSFEEITDTAYYALG